MGLIPTGGLIKPTDKISLRSFYEDLEDFNKKTIDPITGKMFYGSAQSDLSKKYAKPHGLGDKTAKYKNKDLHIDQMPVVLNERQMQWLEAQGYSIKKKEQEKRVQANLENTGKDKPQEEKDYVGEQIAYEGIREALDDHVSLDDLPN
eukprot:CAMPEP_0205802586 /NCGR_PEP_ID=MMETSP0205-20121125/4980_1 /ASSEMBLY_ACC=CAM_ASM_000278 /TAXON_ID=36767 /ORGANISM="Euplotes focardii, Strain TN1" /LENGTH=147 /DNA_ID=CAMNT_0053069293 /DNA_START=63 /DNA_END=503 /DNA_ORIENTATION=-